MRRRDADKLQSLGRPSVQPLGRGRTALRGHARQQMHHRIPHGRQHLRCAPRAHPAGVFPQRYVTDLVQAVFDPPMVSYQSQQPGSIRFAGRQTGDAVRHFHRRRARHRPLPRALKPVRQARPTLVDRQQRRRPQDALLDPTVPLVGWGGLTLGRRRRDLGGEKPPRANAGWPRNRNRRRRRFAV